MVAESRTHLFSDGWEKYHEGPPATLELYKNWAKRNTDPLAWLSSFSKEHDIGSQERTAIEMTTLCRCIWLSGTYDCLNGPSLACIEEIVRRLSQLTEANSVGSHGRPNFQSVKHFHQHDLFGQRRSLCAADLRVQEVEGRG